MKSLLKVLLVLFALGVYAMPSVVNATEGDDGEKTSVLTRTSDGQPVGTNVDNSYAYDVYEYRTDLHDSRTYNTFFMLIGAALVMGIGGMIVSYSHNRDERVLRKEEIAARREQGQNGNHSRNGNSSPSRNVVNGSNFAHANTYAASNMDSAAHSIMQQQNVANSGKQDMVYNHTDLDLHSFSK